jgi:hypothetical protein
MALINWIGIYYKTVTLSTSWRHWTQSIKRLPDCDSDHLAALWSQHFTHKGNRLHCHQLYENNITDMSTDLMEREKRIREVHAQKSEQKKFSWETIYCIVKSIWKLYQAWKSWNICWWQTQLSYRSYKGFFMTLGQPNVKRMPRR